MCVIMSLVVWCGVLALVWEGVELVFLSSSPWQGVGECGRGSPARVFIRVYLSYRSARRESETRRCGVNEKLCILLFSSRWAEVFNGSNSLSLSFF